MRVCRLRLTVRRIMAAVAVVALMLAAERLVERRAYLLERAEIDADRASDYVNGMVCPTEEFNKPGMYDKMRDYWLESARKYRLAAARPWLPVEPDAPEPF